MAGDYKVAGVRNNNDFGKAGALAYPLEPDGTDPFTYINAGLVVSTNANFWTDWINLNNEKALKCRMAEQDTLNEIFYSGKYKNKLLDPVDSDVYYGTATQYGVGSNWESWKYIKKKKMVYI